jgi:hypothetical protein
MPTLARVVAPHTAGDPMSDVKWCRRSTRRIAMALCRRRVRISHSSVWRKMKRAGYSLRANRKRLSFRQSPHRDEQFKRINALRRAFRRSGDPTISVDAKKRELIGLFKNGGRAWSKEPTDVSTYDFPSDAKGVAIPYGIYEPDRDVGFVVVGTTRNTPAFSVNAIKTWWSARGRRAYPRAKRLLILADSGGSNGANAHIWKRELQRLAANLRIKIVVAHYPTGGSKWNPVEHRLFAPISINWAATPLEDYATVCGFIRRTRLGSGVCCRVRLDRRRWLTAKEKKKRWPNRVEAPAPGAVRPACVLPQWNYTIVPPRSRPRRRKCST